MKIYATADIHGAQHRVNEALSAIKEHSPDVIITLIPLMYGKELIRVMQRTCIRIR